MGYNPTIIMRWHGCCRHCAGLQRNRSLSGLDDFSITNPALFDHSLVLSSKYLTDLYLLEMASRNEGCLVTLDRNIPRMRFRRRGQ